MVTLFLESCNLGKLLELLRRQGRVHGPVRGDDGVVRFTQLTDVTVPDIAALRTMLPPKKYLLFPQETLLTYTHQRGYQTPLKEIQPLILFGLHPCDLAGIAYLDSIFLGDDPDPLYASRRSHLTLIGISCEPDQFCSCHISRSPLPAKSDLFFSTVHEGFIVTGGSDVGGELLKQMRDLLMEYSGDIPDDTRRFFGTTGAGQVMPECDVAQSEWQKLAECCLGCGACSVCCPTCSCFDVLEFGGLDGCSAERVRQWDNCLFKGHGQVAGGMSFRKDRAERFRYRYRHKYGGFGALQGIPTCVGCGRCRVACPAGIDLRLLTGQGVEGI